jgi:hypothetical protein
MEPLKIGESVLSLKNAPDKDSQPRVKYGVYKVCRVMFCPACGTQMINIGEKLDKVSYNIICLCGCLLPSYGLHWTQASSFISVSPGNLKIAENHEMYELCAILRDELKCH